MVIKQNNYAYIDGANLRPIAYLDNQRAILEAQKEKAPDADGTA